MVEFRGVAVLGKTISFAAALVWALDDLSWFLISLFLMKALLFSVSNFSYSVSLVSMGKSGQFVARFFCDAAQRP